MNRYKLLYTITDPREAVNCILFSLDTQLVAVGTDDGYTKIYKVGSPECLLELVGHHSVTALLWHPPESDREYKILIGYGDGTVVAYYIPKSALDSETEEGSTGSPPRHGHPIDFDGEGPVEDFAFNPTNSYLGVVIGSKVFICISYDRDTNEYLTSNPRQLPDPVSLHTASTLSICPRNIHFGVNTKSIVVSYLEHGIVCFDSRGKKVLQHISVKSRIACSSLSQDEHYIVVHNLLTGFDRYDLRNGQLLNTIDMDVSSSLNVVLPVQYIHNDADILVGDARGDVRIIGVSSRIVQSLPHSGRGKCQAVAFVQRNHESYIATGMSEAGVPGTVEVWCGIGSGGSRPRSARKPAPAAPVQPQKDKHHTPIIPPDLDVVLKQVGTVLLDHWVVFSVAFVAVIAYVLPHIYAFSRPAQRILGVDRILDGLVDCVWSISVYLLRMVARILPFIRDLSREIAQA